MRESSLMEARALLDALPKVREWIQEYVRSHESDAIHLDSLPFPRLKQCFSQETFRSASRVLTDQPQNPPLSDYGLDQFAAFEEMSIAAVTYGNCFFVRRSRSHDESLHFHEMVHVVQWNELGADRFLLVYGVSLLQFGYHASPLETMARKAQAQFEAGSVTTDVEKRIRRETREIESVLSSGTWGQLLSGPRDCKES